jgi:hypothetical protein
MLLTMRPLRESAQVRILFNLAESKVPSVNYYMKRLSCEAGNQKSLR